MPIRTCETDLLLVVDIQPDFLTGGALGIARGDAIIAPINALMDAFAHVAATQDWHPPGHASFASSHPGASPFDTIDLSYGQQTLWRTTVSRKLPGRRLTRRWGRAPSNWSCERDSILRSIPTRPLSKMIAARRLGLLDICASADFAAS